jgi:hypothetical protein
MGQIYAAYLAVFLHSEKVVEFLVASMGSGSLSDWQRMWIIAALLKRKEAHEEAIKRGWAIAKETARHEALRAVAAIFVGRFGDAARRKTLAGLYGVSSPYLQAAIYYSSRTWPGAERANARAMWGNQTELNRLLTASFAKR